MGYVVITYLGSGEWGCNYEKVTLVISDDKLDFSGKATKSNHFQVEALKRESIGKMRLG
jgi:hypothetical protein